MLPLPARFVTLCACALLATSCGESVTAARIYLQLGPGVQADQVRVEALVDGVALLSEVEPARPRTLKTGDDIVVLFPDRLAGKKASFVVGGMLAGSVMSRGECSVDLRSSAIIETFVDLGVTTPCAPGQHPCNGTCYPDADAAHCGLSCLSCNGGSGSESGSCVDGLCAITCASGFTKCAGTCVATDSDPQNCGGCGAACPTGQVCQKSACAPNTCTDGQHPCNNECVSNYATATCGYSCTPCPAPTFGTATCDGTSCGISCNLGYHDCGGGICADIGSPDTCGASCLRCPVPPAHGRAICDGVSCGIACDQNFQKCGTQCIPYGQPCSST